MGNGLFAEWQRGLVVRGAAAVALLALPVGIAAAVGFSPSASGLSEGLSSLASGPAVPPSAPAGGDSLDIAISSVTAPPRAAGPGRTGGPDGGGGGTGDIGTGGEGGQGGGAAPAPGTGAQPPAGADDVVPGQVVPDTGGAVDAVPVPVPGGGTPDQVLDEVGGTLNGLLGGRAD